MSLCYIIFDIICLIKADQIDMFTFYFTEKELHSLMDELFEAYNSGEPEMEVNEWKKERDKKRHKQQQEKEKKNKKTEALPVEKPAELPTATASTSSDAVKEAIIVTVVCILEPAFMNQIRFANAETISIVTLFIATE